MQIQIRIATSAVAFCIRICVLQSPSELKMSSSFRNNKRCRYSYLNIRPSTSFLTEYVLPFSKRQALSLLVYEYTSFNIFTY